MANKNREFIFKEPETPLSVKLIDQTLCTTPVPQAASTANRDANMALTPMPKPVIKIDPPAGNYMSGLLSDVQNLANQMNNMKKSPERKWLQKSPEQIRLQKSPERIRLQKSPERLRSQKSPERLRSQKSPERLRSQKSPERLRSQKSPERLKRVDPEKVRQSVESEANSSLGILKQDDLKGLEEIGSFSFCESEMNKDLSQRFEKELGRPSLLLKKQEQKKDPFLPVIDFGNDKKCSGLKDDVKDGLDLKPLCIDEESIEKWIQNITSNKDNSSGEQLRRSDFNHFSNSDSYEQNRSTNLSNPFQGFEKMSMSSEYFISGDDVADRLLEDEKAWAQEVLPVVPQKMSLSGIIESEKLSSEQIKDKLSMSSFIRQGSYPLGSLGGSAEQERPTFGLSFSSPKKKNRTYAILPPPGKDKTFDLDEIPTKDIYDFLEHTEYDEDKFSSSTVSSVASASQIADFLSNMCADTTPRTIAKKLMGKTKKHLTPISEGNQNNEKKRTADLQKSFFDVCSNFKKYSILNEGQENICALLPKGPRVCEATFDKRVLKPMENNYSGGNGDNHTSVCESEKSTRYSSSINSSLDFSGLKDSSYTNQELWKRVFGRSESESSGASTIKLKDTTVRIGENGQVSAKTDQVGLTSSNEDDDSKLHVCIASSVAMDFDIFNAADNAQICTIKKLMYVNGAESTDAAFLELEKSSVILEPHSSMTNSVTVTPLVAEPITIQLEVKREDAVTKEVIVDTVTGLIVGEYPDLKLLSDSIISFDPIHEGCSTFQYIELYNAGKCEVSLTFKILKNSSKNENSVINFEGKEVVDVSLPPGEAVKQKLDCLGIPVETLTKMKATVEVSLVDGNRLNLPELFSLPVSTVIAPCHLNIDQRELILQVGVKNVVSVQNCSPITMKLALIPPAGVIIIPNSVQLEPGQKSSVFVGFDSKNTKGDIKERSSITLEVLPNGKTYEIILSSKQAVYSRPNSASGVTPKSSRVPSPMSPSSSVGSADGSMQLECTHMSLVWASYPVHSKTVKSCMLRNRSMHREKLLISISGTSNCFKLLRNQKFLEDQIQLSLQPMESTSLSVVMLPTHPGAFTSTLCITRINNSNEKKVLPLYGYGGKAKLIPQGVSRDPGQRMWIYLDNSTLSSSFVLKNVGDAPAFVKITQGMEATGVSIAPPEGIVQPGDCLNVGISLTPTLDRLEYLLNQHPESTVSVTNLSLTLGDESTRHRLNRLHRKLRTTEQEVDALWNSRLNILNGLFSDRDMEEVRVLRDPFASLETLWREGIREWNIGVLAERSLLETLRLDSSMEYIDLQNSILDETVLSPTLLLYSVVPRSLTFSLKDCSQILTLENNTLSTVPFKCQAIDGLHLTPNQGVVSSKSCVKVYVSWMEIVRPRSECKIKIIFDNKENIEVPILWKAESGWKK